MLRGSYLKIRKMGMGYAYTNTRVKVMKSKLLKHDDMQRLVKMSVAEITRFLQDTEYKSEINELAMRLKGIDIVEYALNKNLEKIFSRILSISLKKGQIMLYLERYDLMNIKTIIRGKNSHISNDKILKEIIAAGQFSWNFLQKVVEESKNVSDAIAFFKNTEYYPILEKQANDIGKLEDELDRSYYRMVLHSAEKSLRDYMMLEIAVKNYLNELRAKKINIKVDKLPLNKIAEIPFDKDSVEARVYAKKMLVNKAMRMINYFQKDIGPVLGFFAAKENEVNNIRLLVRGKHSQLDEKVIQQHMVI